MIIWVPTIDQHIRRWIFRYYTARVQSKETPH